MNIFDVIPGFFEGFALIISPCILPILPIMLSASITGSKTKALGITAGFVVTFTLFAFFSRQLVHYSGLDLNIVRYSAYGLLFLLSIILLSNRLNTWVEQLLAKLTKNQTYFSHDTMLHDGFFNGFVLGGLVAIIWTPCAGPILAAVIVQTVLQQTNFLSFITLLSFACGASLPMLLITFYGKQLINRFTFLKTKGTVLRQLLGAIILTSVLWVIIQERTSTTAPVMQSTIKLSTRLQDGLWRPYPMPALAGIAAWLNSPPLQLSQLKNHVVLIDFWTYSCINCIRTLPYLNYLNKKYHNKGLIIIGVHTPEFDFESKVANVAQAVKRYNIEYSVALDNQFLTWNNFKNHYWPAHYLMNKQGQIVYEHFGEGDYDILENNIRYLLGIDSIAVTPRTHSTPLYPFLQTPETYLGYKRANSAVSPVLIPDQLVSYIPKSALATNQWSLQGAWLALEDKIIAKQAHARLKIHFKARRVYAVMSNGTHQPIHVRVFVNGQQQEHIVGVNKDSIYELITLPQAMDGILELTADKPGLELYTFTFGS